MFGVGPGRFGEFLDGNPPPILEAALVDDVWGFLAALRDDEVGAEVVRGRLKVGERELGENRDATVAYGGSGRGNAV